MSQAFIELGSGAFELKTWFVVKPLRHQNLANFWRLKP
jgi:hypothetical protein